MHSKISMFYNGFIQLKKKKKKKKQNWPTCNNFIYLFIITCGKIEVLTFNFWVEKRSK